MNLQIETIKKMLVDALADATVIKDKRQPVRKYGGGQDVITIGDQNIFQAFWSDQLAEAVSEWLHDAHESGLRKGVFEARRLAIIHEAKRGTGGSSK